MITKAELLNKLNVIKESIRMGNLKFYHLDSIENFITHLNSIDNERVREKISFELNDYLDVVLETSKNKSHSEEIYKKLYITYIYKIADTYKDEAGFIQKPYFPLMAALMIVLFVVFSLLLNLTTSILIITILFFVAFFYYNNKLRTKRYY
jgi:hypothetical protein